MPPIDPFRVSKRLTAEILENRGDVQSTADRMIISSLACRRGTSVVARFEENGDDPRQARIHGGVLPTDPATCALQIELGPRKPVWPLRHRGLVPRKVFRR